MEVKEISTDKLIPYVRNPRNNKGAVAKVAASIKEFGFRQPIVVDSEMVVVAGHTRLAAAWQLGIGKVPVHVATNLTEKQIQAYRIMDNRSHEDAEWDNELLAIELGDLLESGFDLDLTGFTQDEIDQLLDDKSLTGELEGEDDAPETPVDPKTKLGDIYKLSEHRLMCGDSTSADAVALLMDGQKADMVFTDPPYNINYQGVSDKRGKIKNDKLSENDFVGFLSKALMRCDVMYICCSWQNAQLFKEAMMCIDKPPKAMIVWDKVNPAQHLDKYFKQHELIFYSGEFGGQKTLRGDIWVLKREEHCSPNHETD